MPTPVIAKISADVTGFLTGMSSASGALNSFAALATTPLGIAASAIAAVGAVAIGVGNDWLEATGQIRTGTGATGEALDGLVESAQKVFTKVPESAQTVASVIADLNTRTGLAGESLEALAIQSINLADVTGGDLKSQIEATTRVFGDWSIETNKQSETLDYMFKVSQSTGIGIDSLAQKTVAYGAPLRQLGFDFETSAALMGKWEKEGVNLETVMSGMRIGLANLAESGQDVPTALQAVMDEITALGPGAEATGLAMEVFGKRAGADMAAAIVEGRFEVDELVASLRASEETINAADAASETLGERWAVLTNNASLLLEPLGTLLVDVLGDGLAKAQEVWDAWMFAVNTGFDIFRASGVELISLGDAFKWVSGIIRDFFIAYIGGAMQATLNLLEVLNKIPGLKGTFPNTLNSMRESLEKFRDMTSGTAAATEAANVALTGSKAGTGSGGGLTKAAKTAKVEVFDLGKAMAQADRDTKAFEDSVEKLREASTKDLKELHDSSEDVRQGIEDILDESRVTFPGLISDVQSMSPHMAVVADEFGNVETELDSLATASKTKWEEMAGDVLYSADEQKKAYEGFLTDSIAALRDKQPNLSSAQLAELAKMEADLGTFRKKGSEEMGGFVADSLKELGGFATSAVNSILTPPFTAASMGEKFSAIADQFKSQFVQKGIDYLTGPEGLVTKGVNALLGSLDKVIGKLTGSGGVASALADTFGGGSAGGIADAAGSVGSTAGKAASTAVGTVASLSNPITAIASVGSLISGVIGNFQMARQEGSLNAIEGEVRKSQIHLLAMLTKANQHWPGLDEVSGVKAELNWLNNVTVPALSQRLTDDSWAQNGRLIDKLSSAQPITITVQTMLDGKLIAESVEERMVERNQLQGAFGF